MLAFLLFMSVIFIQRFRTLNLFIVSNFKYFTKIYLSIQRLVLFPQASYVYVLLYCNK